MIRPPLLDAAHVSSRCRWLVTALLATVPTVLAGCGDGPLAGGVEDSAFVATMAELERIERTPGLDSSARVAARAATLQRRGLSRAQLESAAASLADDPRRALALYRAIEVKASGDSAVRRDTMAEQLRRRN